MPGRLTSPPGPFSGGPSDLRRPEPNIAWQPDPRRINGIITWRPRGYGHPSTDGKSYPTTAIDRPFSISASALTNKLPLIYTEKEEPIRIQGLLIWLFDYDPKPYLGIIAGFGHGEIGSITSIKLNQIPIADCSFVSNYGSSTGPLSGKPGYSFLADSLPALNIEEVYPGIVDVGMLLKKDDPNMPSSLSITALCEGRIIEDYRTSTSDVSANVPLCLYDVLTLPEIGCGIDPSRVDTGVGSKWRELADWCDDVMSDSSRRYHFIGALTQDPWIILKEIQKHAFIELDNDGQSFDLFGWYNPSVVTDEFDVGLDDWRDTARWREIPIARRPNQLEVNYKVGELGEPAYYPAEQAGIDSTTLRHQALSFAGCRSRSAAARLGNKTINLAIQETHEWNGDIRASVMEGVERGAIGVITTHDGEDGTRVRLIDRGEPLNGWVGCSFCLYGPTTDSEDVEDEIDTVPPYAPEPPPTPSTYTETIVHYGDWTGNSLTGSDGDNLTTLWSDIDSAITYNGTEDATIMTVDSGKLSGYIFEDISVPAKAESLKITVAAKFWDEVEYDGTAVYVQLYDTGTTSVVWTRQLTPPDDRYVVGGWSVDLGALAQEPDRVRIFMVRDVGLVDQPEIAFKRVFVVPAGVEIPESSEYKVSGFHGWTAPTDPGNLVRGYRAIKDTVNGTVVVAELDEDETTYEYPIIYQALPQTVISLAGSSTPSDVVAPAEQPVTIKSSFLVIMQSTGASLFSSFPAPTQAFSFDEPAPVTGTYNKQANTTIPNEFGSLFNWTLYSWIATIPADSENYDMELWYQLSVGGEFEKWAAVPSAKGGMTIGVTTSGASDAQLPTGTIYGEKVYLVSKLNRWKTEWSLGTSTIISGTPLTLATNDVLYWSGTAWINGPVPGTTAELTKQISGGSITITSAEIGGAAIVTVYVQVESGTEDDLEDFSAPEGVIFVLIPDDSAKTVNCIADAAVSNPLRLHASRNFALSHRRDTLTVIAAGAGARGISYSYNEGLIEEDLRISSFFLGPASSTPTARQFKTDGSGSIGTYLYYFEDAKYQHLFFNAQFPHQRKDGTDITPHVHYVFYTNQTGTFTVEFEFEYSWADIDAAFPTNNTVVTITDTVTNPVAGTHYVAWGSPISGTGKNFSSMQVCRVSRDARVSNTVDTYPDDVGILEFDIHFWSTEGTYEG